MRQTIDQRHDKSIAKSSRQSRAGWGSTSVLLALSIGIGWGGGLGWGGGQTLTPFVPLPAMAQATPEPEITEAQIAQFASVVLEMEPIRIAAQKQATTAPDDAAKNQIRQDFVRQATKLITQKGMTVADYNRIALKVRDPNGLALKQKIEQTIIALQQSATPSPQPSP